MYLILFERSTTLILKNNYNFFYYNKKSSIICKHFKTKFQNVQKF
jgi:hypothetical protein